MSSPPFPWRASATMAADGVSSSDLLRRVQDFLPQIHAANAATTLDKKEDCVIDKDLLVDEKQQDDDESPKDHDQHEFLRVAKKARTDHGDDDDEPAKDEAAPTIQLDLTLGVDPNHPAMTLLGKSGDDDGNSPQNLNHENGQQASTSKAEQAVQNLLHGRQTSGLAKAKGPLITEVAENDD